MFDTIASLMILCGICCNGKCDVKFMWLRPTQFVQCAGKLCGHPYRPCVPSAFWIWLCENWCGSQARSCDWWRPQWPPSPWRRLASCSPASLSPASFCPSTSNLLSIHLSQKHNSITNWIPDTTLSLCHQVNEYL